LKDDVIPRSADEHVATGAAEQNFVAGLRPIRGSWTKR
jgi:hypothetical protein